MKPKVGILTTFTGVDAAYSLVNVVRVQLQMLLQAGYHPVLLVADEFTPTETGLWSGKVVEIRQVGPHNAPAESLARSMRTLLADIQVLICHDIIFLSQHSNWSDALFHLNDMNLALLHWQHSRGGHVPRDAPGNSWIVYPNQGDLAHVAQLNNVEGDRVAYVPHPLDFDYLGWPKLAVKIAADFAFCEADIAMVLPTRLDVQKQVERVVRIFAGLKRAGQTVCLLVADAYATGDRFKNYKRKLRRLAEDEGLTDKEFAFLGEHYEACTFATPRPVVKALYEMANLFIQASNAESSSLVVLEAALAGNLCIINADFPPIHHLYQKALTLPFGSVLETTEYYKHVRTADGAEEKVSDPQAYWDDQAREVIIPTLRSHTALGLKRQQLQDRWPTTVFGEFMEPLILEAAATVQGNEVYEPQGDPQVTAIITGLDNLPMLQKQIPVLLGEVGEIIVVNNGSRDGTRKWLDDLHHPRVRAIHKENNGAGPGRNAGLDMWNGSTPYVLMLDGGILPPQHGVQACVDFLVKHPDIDVISPEVASCFTTDESQATLIVPPTLDVPTFPQRCLSSTAYALCKSRAWDGLRFSEEGPLGQPGWGVDDNEMAYQWDDTGIIHHDFTEVVSGWQLYRRASGSFKRLYEETGIWPNQYGSVYERRNVKVFQDYWRYHRMLYSFTQIPTVSYIIQDVPMPTFAKLVKGLHNKDKDAEIIVHENGDLEVKEWLDTFALRWPWGDVTIDPQGRKLVKGQDYPAELWSGDVITGRGPVGAKVITITAEDVDDYLADA